MIPLWKGKNPIYFVVIRSKVKVTYYKYNFWQQGRFHTITLVLYIGSLPNLATWFPCGRGRILFILGSLPLYRLIIYIDRHILWCTHFLFSISWREQVNFQWNNDEIRFVLDQHVMLDIYSASSLKQQSTDRHVTTLGNIILILSQPVFALSPECCVLSGEATNINLIFFGLTWPGLEPTIYRT
jgi:hypothetical protein